MRHHYGRKGLLVSSNVTLGAGFGLLGTAAEMLGGGDFDDGREVGIYKGSGSGN